MLNWRSDFNDKCVNQNLLPCTIFQLAFLSLVVQKSRSIFSANSLPFLVFSLLIFSFIHVKLNILSLKASMLSSSRWWNCRRLYGGRVLDTRMCYRSLTYPSSCAFNLVQTTYKSKNSYGWYALVVLVIKGLSRKIADSVPSILDSISASVTSLLRKISEQAQTLTQE